MKHKIFIIGLGAALCCGLANAKQIFLARCDTCNVTIQDDQQTRAAALAVAEAFGTAVHVGDVIRTKNLGGTLNCEGLLKQDFVVKSMPLWQDSQLSSGQGVSPCELGAVTPRADMTGWTLVGIIYGYGVPVYGNPSPFH